METGLSSPAHRQDDQGRLPVREAHFIIGCEAIPGNIWLKHKGPGDILPFGVVYSGDISPEYIVGGVCASTSRRTCGNQLEGEGLWHEKAAY